MELTRETLLKRLLTSYSAYYDVQQMPEEEAPLVASAAFHVHSVKYVLVQKAQLWAADCNEYIYLYSMPHLTMELYEQCLQQACDLGMPQIEPDENHMSSYIVAVFLCDSCDEDAKDALKHCRIRKDFQFSLKGWLEVHTTLAELGKDSVVSNGDGRKTAEFLKNVLHPKSKKRGLFRK